MNCCLDTTLCFAEDGSTNQFLDSVPNSGAMADGRERTGEHAMRKKGWTPNKIELPSIFEERKNAPHSCVQQREGGGGWGGDLLRKVGASRSEMFMLDRALLDCVRDLEKTQAPSDPIPLIDTVQHSSVPD